MYLAETVFPAPDSPETTIVWLRPSRSISLCFVSVCVQGSGQEDIRESLLCYSKQMRRLCLALLAGVNLNHARDVERVDAGEGVGSNKDDA